MRIFLTLHLKTLHCSSRFLLQASQPDELTIEEHEVLEVIEDGDMEDWVKVSISLRLFSFCYRFEK